MTSRHCNLVTALLTLMAGSHAVAKLASMEKSSDSHRA